MNHVDITDVADYWNRMPCNIKHSAAEVGSKQYFDEVEHRKYFVEPHIPAFADFPAWEGKRVLEVGCGLGTDTINFARAGAEVTAVDLSVKSLELAKKRAEVFGLEDQIKFYNANSEKLSETVPVEPYDLIYSFGVIHHTPNPDAAMQELHKYAGEDTSLKMMLYNKWSWKSLHIVATEGKGKFWQMDELIARRSERQIGSPVTYTYTRKSAKDFVERAGFKDAEVSADHIFPYSIPEYVNYEYKKTWYFEPIPDRIFAGLEKALGWHLLVDARS